MRNLFIILTILVTGSLAVEVITGDAYIYSEWNSKCTSYFLIRSNTVSIVSPPLSDSFFMKYYITNSSDIVVYIEKYNNGAHPFKKKWYGYQNPIDNEYLFKTSATLYNLYCYFNYYTTEPMYRP